MIEDNGSGDGFHSGSTPRCERAVMDHKLRFRERGHGEYDHRQGQISPERGLLKGDDGGSRQRKQARFEDSLYRMRNHVSTLDEEV